MNTETKTRELRALEVAARSEADRTRCPWALHVMASAQHELATREKQAREKQARAEARLAA